MIEKDTLQFLADLKANNNRDWFLANQARYAKYKDNYQRLVREFIDVLSESDPSLKHLEVKDCMFRINRDIRFSKDKSPYKTHMGIWISSGQKKSNLAGYYIHIEPGSSFVAGGVYRPENADLKKIRKEIAFFYDELEKIVSEKSFADTYGDFDRNDETQLKTAPRDFEKDHPAIEFLKLKSFTATRTLSDKELADKNFVRKASEKLLVLKPLNEFLNRALTDLE